MIKAHQGFMFALKTNQILYTNLVNDTRLSVSHFGIYMALVILCHKNDLINPFPISRKSIMELAHINSIVTYHKCMEQLGLFGYIIYSPSYSYYQRSTVCLLLF